MKPPYQIYGMTPPRQSFYLFDEFRFDSETPALFRDGKRVDATPKALEILRVLIGNAGEVVSKEELIRRVWPDSFVEEANLSHHIFKLRKALCENDERKLIETVPKRGYRFVADVGRKSASAETPPKTKSFGWTVGLAGVLVLTSVLLAVWYFYAGKPDTQSAVSNTSEIRSIAVLPFVNVGGSEDVEYLADGMTESLISSLSQIPELRVKARSSVFRYKGKELAPETIGNELNVQALLNGRIVMQGPDLVLSLELIDPKTESQIWGKQYNQKLVTLASLQADIARDVSENLRARLSGPDRNKIAKQHTTNSQAYVLYLKGRYQLNRKTEEGFFKGIDLFRQALELDPAFALAHAGVADAYSQMSLWVILPPSESFPKARAAAERALELDDSLAEAHTVLAFEKFYYEWDFPGAEAEFRKAMDLNPNYSFAREYYAVQIYEVNPGRRDEAFRELNIAREIDPLSLTIGFNHAALYYFEGRHDDALAELRELQNMDPSFTLGYGLLGAIYREKGMYDEYVDAWLQASSLEGGDLRPDEVAELRKIYRSAGVRPYAMAYAKFLQKRSTERYISPIFVAMHYAMADEIDLSFEWLEKAYADRSSWLVELKVDPVWEKLRPDPRFRDLLRRVGFADESGS